MVRGYSGYPEFVPMISDSCASDRCCVSSLGEDYKKHVFIQHIKYYKNIIFTRRELYFKSGYIRPNLDCNHASPIDLTPNGMPFSIKSIEEA